MECCHKLAVLCRHAVLSAAVLPMLVSSLDAQTMAVHSARDVHLRIESEKAIYRVGDSIRVRLTFRNVSDHTIHYGAAPYDKQARLWVYDDAGRVVEPNIPSSVRGRIGGPERRLKAGAEFTLKSWQRPRKEWLNLRDWGYDLSKPGRYRVVGVPALSGRYLTADGAVSSNEVTFTIEP